MRIENSTPMSTADAAVASTIKASKRLARIAWATRRRSTSPAAVTSRMPASAGLGMYPASGPNRADHDGHRRGRKNARPARRRAGLEVDRRAGQRSRAGQALEEAAADIGQAFGQALAVIVQPLPRLMGDRLGDRERFQQSQDRPRASVPPDICCTNPSGT